MSPSVSQPPIDALRPSPAPRQGAVWLARLLVAMCVLGAYANSLKGPFIFDDIDAIQNNPRIRNWIADFSRGRSPTTLSGRPIAALSFSLEYSIAGSDVVVYHATNVLIHLGCALLLLAIVRANLCDTRYWGQRFSHSATFLAAAVAGLWAVHPLNTEAVTYIVQRTESLASLFYLASLYALVRAADRPGWLWTSATVAFCAAGMASKEIVATAPIVLLLYDRTFLAGSFKSAIRNRWPMYLGLAATWIVLAALVATGARSSSVGFGQGIGWIDYARTQLGVIAHYLRLAIWPSGLVLDEYGWPIAHRWQDVGPGGWLVLALAVATAIAVWRGSAIGFVGAWFFLILAPSSGLVPIVTEIAAEHRMYLPLVALVSLAVFGGYRLAGSSGGRWGGGRWVFWPAIAALVGGMAVLSVERNAQYRTAQSIWKDTVDKRPANPRAHFNLGYSFEQANQPLSALDEFETAFKLQPDYRAAESHIGLSLVQANRLDSAEKFYSERIGRDGWAKEAHFMRGTILARREQWQEAQADFEAAVAADPNDPESHYRLGVVLEQLRNWTQAQREFERLQQLWPGYRDASLRLENARIQARASEP